MIRLAEVRRFALALPEATEAPHFDYASFRVRGKIFVKWVRLAWARRAPKRLLTMDFERRN